MKTILSRSPIVPVVVCDNEEQGIAIAKALAAGGISIMEITLRTERALKVIAAVTAACPQMYVGAGTVLSVAQMDAALAHGARFIVSPGATPPLLGHARAEAIAYLPGVASCSEVMQALSYGFDCLKLFPAGVLGGMALLKALSGPFPQVKFCPTGGIDPHNFKDYLALPNVITVGGTWVVPQEALKSQEYIKITRLAEQALASLLA